MHYKNGRQALEGDHVVGKFGSPEAVRSGVLHSLNAGADKCNGMVTYAVPGGTTQAWVTVGDLLHVEDAFEAGSPRITSPPELSVVNTQGQRAATPESTQPIPPNAA